MTLYDRVRAVTATTGTGPLTMGAAVSGYRPFSVIADADEVPYVIEDGEAWEIGQGVWTAGTGALSRSLVRSSTGALLSLSGAAQVYVAPNADTLNTTVLPGLSVHGRAVAETTAGGIATVRAQYTGGRFAELRASEEGAGLTFDSAGGLTLSASASPDNDAPTGLVSITASGNVGIGTDAPLTRLDVEGPQGAIASFRGAAAADSRIELHRAGSRVGLMGWDAGLVSVQADVGGRIGFLTGGVEVVTVASNGRVGVGQLSPSARLEVRAEANGTFPLILRSANGSQRTEFGIDTSGHANMGLYNSTPSRTLFLASNGNSFINGGNLGIGVSAPAYKLEVNGSFGFAPGSSVSPASNGAVVFELTNNSTLTVKARGTDGTVRTATISLS